MEEWEEKNLIDKIKVYFGFKLSNDDLYYSKLFAENEATGRLFNTIFISMIIIIPLIIILLV